MPYPLSIADIDAEIAAIAANANYSAFVQVSNLPNQTAEGRTVKLIRIGTGSINVMIVGGVHAREWAPPDAVLEWVKNLLEAKRLSTAFTDSSFSWPSSNAEVGDAYTGAITFDRATIIDAPTVQRIINSLSIFVIPCANPDGRNFTLTGAANMDWRKNRHVLGASCGEIGVDINRNFPICFNYRSYYNAAAASSSLVSVSDTPCYPDPANPLNPPGDSQQVYQGASANSEPETQNIMSVQNGNNIRFYIDVHAFQREIYYCWGLNPNQTTDASKTFLNTTLNAVSGTGGRDVGNLASYGEFVPSASFLSSYISCANAMQQAIARNAGSNTHAQARSNYQVKQSFSLYSAPGASDDYIFSTQLSASGNNAATNSRYPIYAFTIETGEKNGAEGGFHPSALQYQKIRREIWSALAGLTGFAANWVAPAVSSPPPPTTPPPASGDSWCFVATAVYCDPDHVKVKFLRHFRDVDMKANRLSSFVIAKVNKVYNKYGPRAARYVRNKPLLRKCIQWLLLEPVIGILRLTRYVSNILLPGINYTYILLFISFLSVCGALSYCIHALLIFLYK